LSGGKKKWVDPYIGEKTTKLSTRKLWDRQHVIKGDGLKEAVFAPSLLKDAGFHHQKEEGGRG